MHQGLHATDKLDRLLLGFAGDDFLAELDDPLFEIHRGWCGSGLQRECQKPDNLALQENPENRELIC